MKKKVITAFVAFALVLMAAVGGTVAWLIDSTDEVVNTFTYGDIDINLTETENTYKIVPGNNINKDPKVTVKSGSEACWLFVKVTEANWPENVTSDNTRKVDYSIAEGWTALEGVSGVYYREVASVSSDTDYYVLSNNQIVVSGELTKEEITVLKTTSPTLTFIAYAVQKDSNITTAADAWSKIPASQN